VAAPRRIEKINNLLKDELANLLNREFEFTPANLVTITRVVASPDLHYAKIMLSIIGQNRGRVLEILKKNIYDIQQDLNRRLRFRPIPKITFTLDEEEEKREVIEKSLAELKQKGDV